MFVYQVVQVAVLTTLLLEESVGYRKELGTFVKRMKLQEMS